MNCRQGDIARTVDPMFEEDLIVTCVEFIGRPDFGRGQVMGIEDCWLVDRMMNWVREEGGKESEFLAPFVPDRYLRPIRDSGAPDEIVELVGKPETVSA